MANITDVCDYIIVKLDEAGDSLSVLKLQKLLYYVQAWSLAINNARMFNGSFQAWVHGPVNREIYNRFSDTKLMYSALTVEDIEGTCQSLTAEDERLINDVLDEYASFSGSQLEEITHNEAPWQEARSSLPPNSRCEAIISEDTMRSYYSKNLSV